ncbi:MAG: hypothetical protein B0D92_07575 [Spirochaeta sp. LUC14_002_19_P3]|nr:MAG: hypothetical protein B0D92_07575 [Spirochaeta sp. LUC14_002_19_P3]
MKGVDEKIVAEIRRCKTREALHAVLEIRGITTIKEKALYLKASTGEIATYYDGGDDDLTEEQRYLDDEFMFLDGTWRKLQTGN